MSGGARGTSRRALALALLAAGAAGCGTPPELALQIRVPDDPLGLLKAVTKLDLTATRDEIVLAHGVFSAGAGSVSLAGVSHGGRTVFTLDGIATDGSIIAQGRTCDVDFEGAGSTASLYFAPTSFFAATKTDPVHERADPVAMALDDGTVLLAGGVDAATGKPVLTSELFTPGLTTFTPYAAVMNKARTRAQGTPLPSIGLLVTGGIDPDGKVLSQAEIYFESQQQFLTTVPSTAARVDHRAVILPDGSTFVSGGSATDGGTPLGTTELVIVTSEGTFQVNPGPNLVEARRSHAVAVAVGIPHLFGGYDAHGAVLASIEYVDPAGVAATVAALGTARARATATLLANGSILVVGGVGADGAPLAAAELYNPITRTVSKTIYTLAVPRSDHTATLLSDGRVLISGGRDARGAALSSVELFVPDIGFVTERSLGTARAGHVAVPLCDGTVLVAGGGTGAELYSGPAD